MDVSILDELQQSTILQALRLYRMVFNFPAIVDMMPKDGSVDDENGTLDYLIGLFMQD